MSHNEMIHLEKSPQASSALVNIFLDIKKFPADSTKDIITYIKYIPLDRDTKEKLMCRCKDYLSNSKNLTTNDPLVKRATAVKEILSNNDEVTNPLSNLIISEVNITETNGNNLRNKGNGSENHDDSLSNLIIEEVDVADYVTI